VSNVVEILVKALVDSPDKVEVREVEGQGVVTYEVRVAEDDLGKVIGKEGKIADALRTVAKAAALRDKKRVFVQIIS